MIKNVLHFKIFIKALVCKTKQLKNFVMNDFIVVSKLLVSKKNVSPMEIPRDFSQHAQS